MFSCPRLRCVPDTVKPIDRCWEVAPAKRPTEGMAAALATAAALWAVAPAAITKMSAADP